MDNLFFDGDLQAGISLALTNNKIIACFVTGSNDESLLWQDTFLRDDEVAGALATEAITLRIEEHSLEASYLSAYYQISASPTVILIYQGQLLLEIKSGLSKDDFTHAIIDAIKAHSDIRSTVSSETSTFTPPSATPSSSNLPTASGANLDQNASPAPIISSTSQQNSSTVQDLLQDRRQRLEAEKKEKDAMERADQRAKAEIRRNAVAAAPDSEKAKQASYARQQRRRQDEERLERERIMREILHDKTARREREERRRALVRPISEGAGAPDSPIDEQPLNELSSINSTPRKVCALQVRLFDGSTIRRRFASNETLRNHVRPWIDKIGSDGDKPFTFKQILYPVPNRTVSISDEDATLQSLGFMPSATLVKVPVQRFSDAYVADQGIISRGISTSYNVAIAGVNVITGLMGTILGFGPAISSAEESAVQTVTAAEGSGSGVDIRPSRRQRPGSPERQFYNGNQLNFEPRQDDEDT